MSDELDDDMNEPKVPETAKAETLPAVPKKSVELVGVEKAYAIAPRNFEEAWRMGKAFMIAGMVPDSLRGNTDEATQAKVTLVIMKGLEVGLSPVGAVQNIMVVNNKPSIFGDGVSSLLQNSGKVEYIKTDITGTWGDTTKDYLVTVTLKRKDQTEPYVRSFGYEDAKRAGLIGKKGPWSSGFGPRMCYWRALSWAARDGAGDALMGLGIAEEVQDYMIEQKRDHKADTSSLDDEPVKQIEA